MQNNKPKFKIIFLGSGEFGKIILQRLIRPEYEPIVADDFKKIKELKPDLVIVASFGKIIPKEILEIPKYGCLNVHPSLLPKYRGPSPIQTAILNGDRETGVTIILMNEKIDQGKIISNFQFPISNERITYQELSQKLAEKGAKLLIETIPKWIKGEIKPRAQDESKATYTKIFKKEDGKINWKKPPEEIERQVRAFYPWPGAFTFIKHRGKTLRIKILEVDISKDNKSPTFGQGFKPSQKVRDKLIIKKLQPEGKKPMSFEEFKRGHYDFNPLP